jgi:hypothetical protein
MESVFGPKLFCLWSSEESNQFGFLHAESLVNLRGHTSCVTLFVSYEDIFVKNGNTSHTSCV